MFESFRKAWAFIKAVQAFHRILAQRATLPDDLQAEVKDLEEFVRRVAELVKKTSEKYRR
jgi:hypothetical protein